jgi:hypothetical protein
LKSRNWEPTSVEFLIEDTAVQGAERMYLYGLYWTVWNNDVIKNQFAVEKGLKLIRIKYTEKVDKVLSENLL